MPAAFQVREEHVATVMLGVSEGFTHEQICEFITHPDGKPITKKTLYKHFRHALKNGVAFMKLRSASGLSKLIDKGDLGAIKYWEQTRLGYTTKHQVNIAGHDGGPIDRSRALDELYAKVDRLGGGGGGQGADQSA